MGVTLGRELGDVDKFLNNLWEPRDEVNDLLREAYNQLSRQLDNILLEISRELRLSEENVSELRSKILWEVSQVIDQIIGDLRRALGGLR
ncbi:MAG: hypothetical protein DRO13_00245 [Thermoprotei archaeon]|nr:MAG: hypothetical protein DRO13_00020 [Thermoprotei archaeon]RLG81829.1 MAG: hypothetical protein DRO13_00245 [Thermoprotei archaeon]